MLKPLQKANKFFFVFISNEHAYPLSQVGLGKR